jgi:hypothetical protein
VCLALSRHQAEQFAESLTQFEQALELYKARDGDKSGHQQQLVRQAASPRLTSLKYDDASRSPSNLRSAYAVSANICIPSYSWLSIRPSVIVDMRDADFVSNSKTPLYITDNCPPQPRTPNASEIRCRKDLYKALHGGDKAETTWAARGYSRLTAGL